MPDGCTLFRAVKWTSRFLLPSFAIYFIFLFYPIAFPDLSTRLVGFVPSLLLCQRLPGWCLLVNKESTLCRSRSPLCVHGCTSVIELMVLVEVLLMVWLVLLLDEKAG